LFPAHASLLRAAVIGGGPAGLMAAEALAGSGLQVDVYDAMPSLARKFLLAGKGGLNITHSEPLPAFLSRYAERAGWIGPLLDAFGPQALRQWVHALGIETFVGTSGRVFPAQMKAAPLLRAWLHRLREAGVLFHVRHRWGGWDESGGLRFSVPGGTRTMHADVVVLALGGGSWRKLGSDAAWVPLLLERGVPVAALQPANCGFDVRWSNHFRQRFAGHAVKSVAAVTADVEASAAGQRGEFIVTEYGVEGGLIYSLCARLRSQLAATGSAALRLDLAPARSLSSLRAALAKPRGPRSLANHLRSRANLDGVKAGLLRDMAPASALSDPALLAAAIKALPLPLLAPRPLDEAISTAGGVVFEALDEHLMIRSLPGVFCAGEMLDWEAPTGGYLLTACFASGRAAGLGARAWLAARSS
jgi:uncharacterized flavoprotein (TIGR03862 family)